MLYGALIIDFSISLYVLLHLSLASIAVLYSLLSNKGSSESSGWSSMLIHKPPPPKKNKKIWEHRKDIFGISLFPFAIAAHVNITPTFVRERTIDGQQFLFKAKRCDLCYFVKKGKKKAKHRRSREEFKHQQQSCQFPPEGVIQFG